VDRAFRNLERQGWRDEALQGCIHGRFLNALSTPALLPPDSQATDENSKP